MIPFARSLRRGAHTILAPCQCAACGVRVQGEWALCRRCGARLRRESRPPLRARLRLEGGELLPVVSAGVFRGVWARLIRAYKAEAAPSLEPLLVEALLASTAEDLRRLEGTARQRSRIALVPVPMARVRRRERGWNPPERLARELADRTGCALRAGVLERARYRRPMRGLSAAERRQEMNGAFRLSRSGVLDGGKAIVLVDDVVTTGSTLRAAALSFRGEGCVSIRAWTLARTMRRASASPMRPGSALPVRRASAPPGRHAGRVDG